MVDRKDPLRDASLEELRLLRSALAATHLRPDHQAELAKWLRGDSPYVTVKGVLSWLTSIRKRGY